MMNGRKNEATKQPKQNRWQLRLEAERFLAQLVRAGYAVPTYRDGVLVSK